MKYSNILMIILIVSIVLMSGCTDIINQKSTTKVEKKKIVNIDVSVSPKKDIYEGSKLIASAIITNQGQAPVQLYLKDSDGKDSILIDRCEGILMLENISYFPKSKGMNVVSLKPHESINIIWHFSVNKGLSNKYPVCNMKFKVKYKAKAETIAYIYFINPTEKLKDEYLNKKMTLKGTNIATYGPIALYFTPLDKQPISSGHKWIASVEVHNFQKGVAEIDTITIKGPKGSKGASCNRKLEQIKVYGNDKFKTECTFNPVDVDILTPYRYELSADYVYTEEINKKLKILSRLEQA